MGAPPWSRDEARSPTSGRRRTSGVAPRRTSGRAPRGRPSGIRRDMRLLVASYDETGPLINGLLSQVPDIDPAETGEWVESLDGLIDDRGGPRARYVLLNLLKRARERNVAVPASLTTPYVNSIGVH